jgi:hypothetical protein
MSGIQFDVTTVPHPDLSRPFLDVARAAYAHLQALNPTLWYSVKGKFESVFQDDDEGGEGGYDFTRHILEELFLGCIDPLAQFKGRRGIVELRKDLSAHHAKAIVSAYPELREAFARHKSLPIRYTTRQERDAEVIAAFEHGGDYLKSQYDEGDTERLIVALARIARIDPKYHERLEARFAASDTHT